MFSSAFISSMLLLGGTITYTFKSGETNSVVAGSEVVVGLLTSEVADSVVWGDGSFDSNVSLPVRHVYSAAPTSQMSISWTSLDTAYPDIVRFEGGSVPAFSSVSLNGIRDLASVCFAGYAITQIDFGSACERIDEDAFRGCLGLTSVEIPGSVTNVTGNPFTGCDNLVSVTVSSGNPAYSDMGMNLIYDTQAKAVVGWCRTSAIPQDAEIFDGDDVYVACACRESYRVKGYPDHASNVALFSRDLTRETWGGGWPTGTAHSVFTWFWKDVPRGGDLQRMTPTIYWSRYERTEFLGKMTTWEVVGGFGGTAPPPIPRHLKGIVLPAW